VTDPAVTDPARTTAHADSAKPAVEHGLATASRWALRLLVLGVAAYAALWLIGKAWSIILPLALGLLLAAVLWPLAQLLRRRLPHALAAIVSILLLLGIVGGVFAVLVPDVAGQSQLVVDSASDGLNRLQAWISGPPLNLGDDQLGQLVDRGVQQLQTNAQSVALTLAGGLGSVSVSIGSGLVTFLLVLVLAFFCLSDGDRLLPWSRRWLDERAHHHAQELGGRIWKVLQGYILSQAAVALVDAVFIGTGLAVLRVPFALPLAVLIFFAAFIPIVGAVVSGAVAVLVALVTLGWVQALIVLGIVLLVQQLEGNVLQPFLVGRTLSLHPVVVIGSVTVGGTVFGIVGAFLAVPVVAIITAVLRYVRHVQHPEDPENPGERRVRRGHRPRLGRTGRDASPEEPTEGPAEGPADAPGTGTGPRTPARHPSE
jgi:predicted PurR-regulated permease PerM